MEREFRGRLRLIEHNFASLTTWPKDMFPDGYEPALVKIALGEVPNCPVEKFLGIDPRITNYLVDARTFLINGAIVRVRLGS